jgi:1,4-dihydroxy-2-naphthoyl-CoA synthase
MPEHLRVTKEGPVATVTMARPEVHNAFNQALIAELHTVFEKSKPKWATDVETSRRDVSDAPPKNERRE